MTHVMNPYALPATTHSYLARAAESLSEAMTATDVPTRYACAHVAALRAAAALLAARAHPAPTRGRRQKNAWVLLAEVAPELAEWATFFAAGAAKRAAAEAGSTRAVTEREADDLVRDADRFLGGGRAVPRAGAARPRSAQLCPPVEPVPTTPRRLRPAEPVDPFVHLHVASGYSLQHGASHPHVLVERAAEHEMDTLALTDRDGTYGAVKFAQACRTAGIRPVLGVDLAYRRWPRGGPRPGQVRAPPYAAARSATRPGQPAAGHLLASAGGPGGGRAGWAAICRLVSAVHLAGERGRPVVTLDLLAAPWLATGDVMVLLGPGSELGARSTRRRDDLADAALAPWRELVPAATSSSSWSPTGSAAGPGAGRGVPAPPRTPPGWPGWPGAPGSAPCSPTRSATPTATTPRPSTSSTPPAGWSPLDRRHVDRANAEGFLKSGKQMLEVAEEICRMAGSADATARPGGCWPAPARSADRCALDPRADLGLGEVHFPTSSTGRAPAGRPTACCALAARGRSATATAPRRGSASGSGSTTS